MGRRRKLAPHLALGACLLAAGSACGGPSRTRALVVGIDGATLRVIQPLLEQGRLPNLARIAERGVHGPLRSVQPLLSPRIWNSIATGKSAEKHGITNFARKDEQGEPELLLSTDRRAHALWNIASDAGLRVAVVNWWNTYPPERVGGVMVSDHMLAREIEGRREMTHAHAVPTGPVVYPEAWAARLADAVHGGAPPVAFGDPFAGETLPHWIEPPRLSRIFREDAAIARIALEIEAAEHPDLLMVLLVGIDRTSHFLWGNLEPPERYPENLRPSAAERAGGARALERYYEYSDALIGEFLTRYSPDDLVVVVSDHGFEAGAAYGFLTGVHESKQAVDGVLFASGRGLPRGEVVQGVGIYDVAPTVLAWLGLPTARDMDGQPAAFVAVTRDPVESYETTPVERVSTAPSGADAELIEQLRQLGYIQ